MGCIKPIRIFPMPPAMCNHSFSVLHVVSYGCFQTIYFFFFEREKNIKHKRIGRSKKQYWSVVLVSLYINLTPTHKCIQYDITLTQKCSRNYIKHINQETSKICYLNCLCVSISFLLSPLILDKVCFNTISVYINHTLHFNCEHVATRYLYTSFLF
jgi:hypothetical protein